MKLTPVQTQAALIHNAPLARMISADASPVQADHLAKAFKVETPKTHFTPALTAMPVGNPWAMIGQK